MTFGTVFPTVTVFYDGKEYWLANGFHRVTAAIIAGITEIDAEVIEGTKRDAILYAVGCNSNHGLRRTNADKRRAVMMLLGDAEWVQWSNYKIEGNVLTVNRQRVSFQYKIDTVKSCMGLYIVLLDIPTGVTFYE